MRATIFQPPYPGAGEAEAVIDWQVERLKEIAPGATNLVVLPENSNCTGASTLGGMLALMRGAGAKYEKELRTECERIGCIVMAGLMTEDEKGVLRNQLGVFEPGKETYFPYTKNHLVKPELEKGIVPGEKPEVFEIDGVLYGAAICYDFYFPELFDWYQSKRIDVLVIVSHQRQESAERLEFLTRARAFDCGCTVLRSAPAMPKLDVCGRSMAVAPDGLVLAMAGGTPTTLTFDFNPKARFVRPASYGEPDRVIDYRESLIEAKRPELYR